MPDADDASAASEGDASEASEAGSAAGSDCSELLAVSVGVVGVDGDCFAEHPARLTHASSDSIQRASAELSRQAHGCPDPFRQPLPQVNWRGPLDMVSLACVKVQMIEVVLAARPDYSPS